MPLAVDSPWFAGAADIPTFSREELLATKLRALLQRDKGRDLFDLDHALARFENLDIERLVAIFGMYLAGQDQAISRAEAQRRMFAKLANPRFLIDMRPLLPAVEAERLTEAATTSAFVSVFTKIVDWIPGDPWARADEMIKRFGLTAHLP
jgi:predicted nucleotidyltransferase component of viral defense system